MTEEEVKKLWLDKNYRGSYTGLSTFVKALRKDKKIKAKETNKKVLHLLESIPSYQMHVRKKRNYETRHLHFLNEKAPNANYISGMGINFMMDLAFMPVASDGKFIRHFPTIFNKLIFYRLHLLPNSCRFI
jgi:hypothetical protein